MGNNHKKRSIIPSNATTRSETKYINKEAASLYKEAKSDAELNVFISLRHIQHQFQCFSVWDKADMLAFWDLNRRIHEITWQDLYATATKSKNDKKGLGYTPIARGKYPNPEFVKMLSPDVTLFEVRVSQKARIHGFRDKAIFYVCWLDRNHEIT